MVLVNAIYFKGKWNQEFSVEDTKKAPFKLEYEE
jgi:serine protease inhibitor